MLRSNPLKFQPLVCTVYTIQPKASDQPSKWSVRQAKSRHARCRLAGDQPSLAILASHYCPGREQTSQLATQLYCSLASDQPRRDLNIQGLAKTENRSGHHTAHLIHSSLVPAEDSHPQGLTFHFLKQLLQHCFICSPSDSTVSEDAGIEPRAVETFAFTVRCNYHSDRQKLQPNCPPPPAMVHCS